MTMKVNEHLLIPAVGTYHFSIFGFIVLQGLLGLAYPPVGAWGDHVIVGSWLDSVECFLEYSVSFKLELCGVQNRSNATHYGRFSMICK